jgi:hypothetical protein
MLVFRVNINKKIRFYWEFIGTAGLENLIEDQEIVTISNRKRAIKNKSEAF